MAFQRSLAAIQALSEVSTKAVENEKQLQAHIGKLTGALEKLYPGGDAVAAPRAPAGRTIQVLCTSPLWP